MIPPRRVQSSSQLRLDVIARREAPIESHKVVPPLLQSRPWRTIFVQYISVQFSSVSHFALLQFIIIFALISCGWMQGRRQRVDGSPTSSVRFYVNVAWSYVSHCFLRLRTRASLATRSQLLGGLATIPQFSEANEDTTRGWLISIRASKWILTY